VTDSRIHLIRPSPVMIRNSYGENRCPLSIRTAFFRAWARSTGWMMLTGFIPSISVSE